MFFWWFYNTHHFPNVNWNWPWERNKFRVPSIGVFLVVLQHASFRSFSQQFRTKTHHSLGCLGAEFYNLEPKKMTWELFFDPGIFLEFISHHFIPNAKLSPASNVFDQIQLSLGTFFFWFWGHISTSFDSHPWTRQVPQSCRFDKLEAVFWEWGVASNLLWTPGVGQGKGKITNSIGQLYMKLLVFSLWVQRKVWGFPVAGCKSFATFATWLKSYTKCQSRIHILGCSHL